VQTFTVQSSFKYDHPPEMVRMAIEKINSTTRKQPLPIDEADLLPIVEKTMKAYQEEISSLAPIIMRMSRHIPQRRARKLHVGLFGYSRKMGDIKLPRAISFCASLYSIGLPPELLGLSALSEKDWDMLRGQYLNLEEDLQSCASFANKGIISKLPNGIQARLSPILERFGVEPNEEYVSSTNDIWGMLDSQNTGGMKEAVIKAAWLRGFLG